MNSSEDAGSYVFGRMGSNGGNGKGLNSSAELTAEHKSMASVSKAIVALEMARLAPSPRDHMLQLLRDLQDMSSSSLGILSPVGHGGRGRDEAIAARCLDLLSIAYPAEFSLIPSGESSEGDAAVMLRNAHAEKAAEKLHGRGSGGGGPRAPMARRTAGRPAEV